MTAEELRALYQPLHAEALDLARQVFEGGLAGLPPHPCAYLVRDAYHDAVGPSKPPDWPASWRQSWHLPEPFIGEVVEAAPQVAFVGVNPSIDWREKCPTVAADLDEWLAWWRRTLDGCGRFHAAVQPIPLYEEYGHILRCALGSDATLGREAVVLDAIHYKAVKPKGSLKKGGRAALRAALEHRTSVPLTVEVLRRLGVKVIVTVGGDSTRSVGAAFVPELAKAKITAVHGNAYPASGGVTVIPSLHRNARFYPRAKRFPVMEQIARALGRAAPHPSSQSCR